MAFFNGNMASPATFFNSFTGQQSSFNELNTDGRLPQHVYGDQQFGWLSAYLGSGGPIPGGWSPPQGSLPWGSRRAFWGPVSGIVVSRGDFKFEKNHFCPKTPLFW